jgi:hypothetical protein
MSGIWQFRSCFFTEQGYVSSCSAICPLEALRRDISQPCTTMDPLGGAPAGSGRHTHGEPAWDLDVDAFLDDCERRSRCRGGQCRPGRSCPSHTPASHRPQTRAVRPPAPSATCRPEGDGPRGRGHAGGLRHVPRRAGHIPVVLSFYRFIPSASAYTAILLGAPRGDPTPIRGSVSTVPSRFFARFAPSFGLHDL